MARKQYGVAVEVEDSKRGVGDGRWKWEWQWEWQSGPVSRGGITLPAYFHSFVSTSTSADDCKVMECITGCSGYYMLYSPPIYLHFCVSAGSDGAWMCTLLVALLAYPSSIYAFIYLTFQLHIFAQKRVPNRKDDGDGDGGGDPLAGQCQCPPTSKG